MPTEIDRSAAGRKVLIWSIDPTLPSFRLRLTPVARILEERGWRVEIETLSGRPYILRIIERRREIAEADLVLLAKFKLGHGEASLLRRWSRRVVFDFDDAIHLRKPRSLGLAPERSWNRHRRFAQTCAASDLVLAGNRFLQAVASPYSGDVEIVPTPVDCSRTTPIPASERDASTVVWVGLVENLVYLEPLRPVFEALAAEHRDFKLRIISSRPLDWSTVPIDFVPWSEAGEIAALKTATVGIMPLSRDDWSRGKCALKLLQYMAAGLPCVATAVGVNREVVEHGVTGLLVDEAAPNGSTHSAETWFSALDRLLRDPEAAERMGIAGRRMVSARFDQKAIALRTVDLLEA